MTLIECVRGVVGGYIKKAEPSFPMEILIVYKEREKKRKKLR